MALPLNILNSTHHCPRRYSLRGVDHCTTTPHTLTHTHSARHSMWTSRQAPTENAMSSTVGLLIFLAVVGQHIRQAEGQEHTTLSPSLSDLEPNTRPANDSAGVPRVLHMHHALCKEEHADFCFNGGTCMYPQDSEKPSCICQPNYDGPRCMLSVSKTTHGIDYSALIGLCVTVFFFIVIFILALLCIRQRCIKKSPQKYGGPETSV